MIANYHSIDTFSSVDGPGIRYVLFLQGCNILCKYCHNVDAAITKVNKQITTEEVIEDFIKYQNFYKNGGITISGGEPLLQIDFIIELFRCLKDLNVHTCLQTQGTLFNKSPKFLELLKVTDLFIVDLKGIDDTYTLKVSNAKIEQTFEFLEFLDKKNKNYIITYVLIPEINDSEYCLENLGKILAKYNSENMSFQILPYHRLGADKWKMLDMKYDFEDVKEPTDEEIKRALVKTESYYQKYLSYKNI